MVDLPDSRPPRLPLYVPVVTSPALVDCWSVNLSETGLGLFISPSAGEGAPLPEEGETLSLEFSLPDVGSTVRARAEVAWRQDEDSAGGGRGGISLGLRFLWMPGTDRLKLKRYLHDYRFHVCGVFASPEEQSLLLEALQTHTTVHFADSLSELRVLLGRGDVSAMIVCGSDDGILSAVIEQTGATRPGGGRVGGERDAPASSEDADRFPHPRSDLAPRLIHFGRVADATLVQHFNSGALFRTLNPSAGAGPLRDAVLLACEEHGQRTEQRRSTQALNRALHRAQALERSEGQLDELSSDRILTRSPKMQAALSLLRSVAPHSVGVLLQGETGVGKEVLARTLHDLSARAMEALVVQDCGALPETLLESELFGHRKGAFTGAIEDRQGLFDLADGGTIFLDEIENTTPKLQAKLLRVLETGAVRPVGSNQTHHVDVRIIAASNRPLQVEVDEGRFRSDLYYRLNTFVIDIPPLRERVEDIEGLAHHFIERFNKRLGHSAAGVSAALLMTLRRYPWPGNVRELRNVLERAVLLSGPGEPLGVPQLPAHVAGATGLRPPSAAAGLRAQLAALELQLIEQALYDQGGIVRRAARVLGLSPVTLGRRMHKLGVVAHKRVRAAVK